MNYCIVIGGHREESQSAKVGEYIERELHIMQEKTETIDLRNNHIPLWNDEMWSGEGELHTLWEPYKKKLHAADALIIVVPEYNGMASAGIKNFFLYVDNKTVAHKPALLVSVSAGNGGAYPIMELRGSSYKNARICYIPDHIILRDIKNILNTEQPEHESDAYIRKRITYSLSMLQLYAKNMKPIRTDKRIDMETYPNGM